MKLEIKTNFSFKKLENYVKRKGFGFRLSRAAAPFIVKDSKNFIREGKVTPDIKQITKDIKKILQKSLKKIWLILQLKKEMLF